MYACISALVSLPIRTRVDIYLSPNRLLKDSFEEMAAFQRALKSLIAAADTDYAKQHPEFMVGLEGSFGSRHVTPRTLTSNQLGNIVCLEGIVTKCRFRRKYNFYAFVILLSLNTKSNE